MPTDFRKLGDDWLTDIYNHSQGGRDSVCSVCNEREPFMSHRIFSVCKKCDKKRESAQFERAKQDEKEFEMTLQTGGPFDEHSKNALEGI